MVPNVVIVLKYQKACTYVRSQARKDPEINILVHSKEVKTTKMLSLSLAKLPVYDWEGKSPRIRKENN